MRYETVLFDADGTLLDFHKGESEAVCEALLLSGVQPNGELVSAYSEINEQMWKRLERGEIKKSELLYKRFEVFCESFSLGAEPKKMAEDYMALLSTKAYLLEGAMEMCERLCKMHELYIVTNGVESIQKGRFSRLSLDKYFKEIFISGEIGYDKPDVRFFEEVERRIAVTGKRLNKEKTLIVGDSLTSDIAGGRAYGIDTCFYSPNKKDIPADMEITCVAQSFDDIFRFITGETV